MNINVTNMFDEIENGCSYEAKTYKRLYNESQEELKELKYSIRNLCGK